ncbi:hypothetical protein MBLNU457_3152t1 [Dothideomycetes sp. NU457]
MAQGAVKSKAPKVPKKPKQTGPSTGNRVIKPKKAALIKQNNMKKKQSSGLSATIEKSMAEKAGHLEMLRGGKADRKDKKAAEMSKAKK